MALAFHRTPPLFAGTVRQVLLVAVRVGSSERRSQIIIELAKIYRFWPISLGCGN